MKKILLASLAVVTVLSSCNGEDPASLNTDISIVPNPVSMEYCGKGVKLMKSTGFPKVRYVIDGSLGEEEYIIDASGEKSRKVIVTAGSDAGKFWADVTLSQIVMQSSGRIAGLVIKDAPEFAYRGSLLDCGRHFWTVDEVKRYIDILVMHKLNVLHWHLTEDQGWRAEIRKYPRLTEIGAYRGEENYGGYYTREDMMDVVKYAAERHVTVIPEIEMPGHSLAALTAYPELGCTGEGYHVEENWGIFPDVYCVGKDTTLHFLCDVLDEICEIFPSEYIHIGGDESPRTRWEDCPDCQRRMQEEGLTEEAELQGWLVRKIEEHLNAKGRRIIGWDEILEGGVTPTATVMSWRGTEGGIAAARQGNDVIMSPYTYFYLDYYQTMNHLQYETEGTAYHSYLPLSKCYSFNPFDGLDDSQKNFIKGIQANAWTEYMTSFEGVEQKALPRLAALSEVAWSTSNRTSYEEFVERCRKALVPAYEEAGYNFADFVFRNPPVR